MGKKKGNGAARKNKNGKGRNGKKNGQGGKKKRKGAARKNKNGKNGNGKKRKAKKDQKKSKKKNGGKKGGKGEGKKSGKSTDAGVGGVDAALYNQLWCMDLSFEQTLQKCVENKLQSKRF